MSRAKTTNGNRAPHPIDVIAGRNLRIARSLAGFSQQHLGKQVGISFQQIQKYERGINRMSISRAYEFSSILGISIDALIENAAWMPVGALLERPHFAEWLALYARAQTADCLSPLIAIAGHAIDMCELSVQGAAQC